MVFRKIEVAKIVDEKIKANPEFACEYEKIIKEYSLIDSVVKKRKMLRLTQNDLAKKIGVSQQVISRFEKEKHNPNLDNFIKILDALDLEIVIREKEEFFCTSSKPE